MQSIYIVIWLESGDLRFTRIGELDVEAFEKSYNVVWSGEVDDFQRAMTTLMCQQG